MYQYAASLVRVIDGDTVVLNVDLGFSTHVEQHVRLNGINAPEHGTPEGDAATAFTKVWFTQHAGLTLATVKDKQEKYGRYLGTITSADGANLNADLVTNGHAVSYDGGKRAATIVLGQRSVGDQIHYLAGEVMKHSDLDPELGDIAHAMGQVADNADKAGE